MCGSGFCSTTCKPRLPSFYVVVTFIFMKINYLHVKALFYRHGGVVTKYLGMSDDSTKTMSRLEKPEVVARAGYKVTA